jgi:parvulin-like peptidyl-prolyl isomerase
MCVCLLLFGAVLALGCGGQEEAYIENEEDLAARVEDWTLTKEFLYDYIDRLPASKKEKYNSPQGRALLAEEIMAEELFYREALREGLADRPDVSEVIEDATRKILAQAYYKEFVEERARPSDDELLEWYNDNRDAFMTLPARRAQHIFSKSEEKLIELRQRFEAGEKFTTLAHKYSEDKLTQRDGGSLGYFNPGGYIRSIGFSETFSDTVFKMEPHQIYGPIKWEKGYSLVLVNEIQEPRLRTFEEARKEISLRLTKERIEQTRREVIRDVRDNYDWNNYMEEYYRRIQRTPVELFEYAQTTSDPYERVRAFEEIVEKFPDDEHAPQALFMVGFVHMEELHDDKTAKFTFKKVLEEYPDSDVADSAKWMLDNMGKPLPEFESVDELNKKLSGD